MSTRYQRKVKTNQDGHINVSKSGISQSQKVGKFTFNSKGTVSYNSSIKGLSFRMNILMGLAFIPVYYMVKATIFLFIKLPFRILMFIPRKLFKSK
jgi:hypothetical protein